MEYVRNDGEQQVPWRSKKKKVAQKNKRGSETGGTGMSHG